MSLRNFIIKSINYNWTVASSGMKNKLNNLNKYPDRKLDEDYIILFPYYEKQKTKRSKKTNKDEE